MASKNRYPNADSTSISGPLLVLLRTLESRGINYGTLFNTIGLDIDHAKNPAARVPTAKMARAWEIAVDRTGDSTIGLACARHLHAAVWYAMSYMFFSCESVLSALQKMIMYQRIIVTVADARLQENGDVYILSWGRHPYVSEQAIDMYGGMIVQMCRQMAGVRFDPLCVTLCRRSPPAGNRPHENFFNAPVQFQAGQNTLHLPRDQCRRILLTGNEELLVRNEALVIEYLERVKNHEFINLVHSRVIESFSEGCMLEKRVAQSMNISRRSLQRRLQAHGTSFRAITESARRKYAMELINDTGLLVSDIGYRLGYSSVGNFSSAFKRWTGLSPSEYRNRHTQTGM